MHFAEPYREEEHLGENPMPGVSCLGQAVSERHPPFRADQTIDKEHQVMAISLIYSS